MPLDEDGISDLEDIYPVGSRTVKVTFTRLHLLDDEYRDGIGGEDTDTGEMYFVASAKH